MKRPIVEIICVGSELLSSKINSHSVYLGRVFESLGHVVVRDHTVGDNPKIMNDVFREVFRRADIVVCCGGLGPTFDDITRDVWSDVLKAPLIFKSQILKDIQRKFHKRGYEMPDQNRRQAYLLKSAQEIKNTFGTAPGQIFKKGRKLLFLLPGPRRELYPMVENALVPTVRRMFSSGPVVNKAFHIAGIPETIVENDFRPIIETFPKVNGCPVVYGILASSSIITIKFQITGHHISTVRSAEKFLTRQIKDTFGTKIFSEDNITLPEKIGEILKRKRRTMATAESCTGGLIGKLITDVPGSSHYFIEGITSYANAAKVRRLGVRPQTIKKFGAVSEEIAAEMAMGLRKKSNVDFAVSVTGVAGPSGGSKEKPVGRVYVGVASAKRTVVKKFQFGGERDAIRYRAAMAALTFLHEVLTV